jgi:aryl-alcohol dehydrogenase-like predicted oxidoreductase
VIVKEVLANGRLTSREGVGEPTFRQLASRGGAGLDAIAIAAALANPWADVVLSGAVTVAQLRSNLGAVRIGLPAEDLAGLTAHAEPPERYWAKRKELPWG